MRQLKLGNWEIPEISGGPPEIGSTFTASILGNSYATAIMPDGKEWMTENLVWDSCGQWYGGRAGNDGDGRFYNWTDCALIISELAATESESGWRVCTYADSWGLVNACKDPLGFYPTLAQPHARWDADGRPTIATNTTGFNAFPQGWKSGYSGEWYPKMYGFPGWKIMTIPANGYATGFGGFSMSKGSDGNISADGGPVDGASSYFLNSRYPVRLVRDPVPTPPTPARFGYHDILFDDAGSAILVEDLAQRVDVRLRTFLGEHWLNPEIGVPYFSEFLVKNPNLSVCRALLLTVIQGVAGVKEVTRLDLSFSKNTNARVLNVIFTVVGTDSIPQTGTTVVPT